MRRAGGFSAKLPLKVGERGPFGSDAQTLLLNVSFVSSTIVRVAITNVSAVRWEVPNIALQQPIRPDGAEREYAVSYSASPFGIKVLY